MAQLFENDSRRLDLNECRRIVAEMIRDSSVDDDYVHEFLLDEVSRHGDGPGSGSPSSEAISAAPSSRPRR